MKNLIASLRAFLTLLWKADRPLAFVGLLMIAMLAAFGAGLALDPRTIAGAPAWLKPAKFALSTAVYALTLGWVFTYLPQWPRTRRLVGGTTAGVFVVEVALIALQAWRGTTSHFNVGTPLDAALFAIMGTGIVLQTIASGFVAFALWRQTFTDRAIGTALRAGMLITIVGASSAGLMTRVTDVQAAELRDTHRLTNVGAHTVGGSDRAAGLPATGWSREHGDLRIPHFVGLHALQVLSLLAVAARRRWHDDVRTVRTVRVVASSYSALFIVLLFQALNGEPLLGPGSTTLTLLAAWVAGSCAAVGWARISKPTIGSAEQPSDLTHSDSAPTAREPRTLRSRLTRCAFLPKPDARLY